MVFVLCGFHHLSVYVMTNKYKHMNSAQIAYELLGQGLTKQDQKDLEALKLAAKLFLKSMSKKQTKRYITKLLKRSK